MTCDVCTVMDWDTLSMGTFSPVTTDCAMTMFWETWVSAPNDWSVGSASCDTPGGMVQVLVLAGIKPPVETTTCAEFCWYSLWAGFVWKFASSIAFSMTPLLEDEESWGTTLRVTGWVKNNAFANGIDEAPAVETDGISPVAVTPGDPKKNTRAGWVPPDETCGGTNGPWVTFSWESRFKSMGPCVGELCTGSVPCGLSVHVEFFQSLVSSSRSDDWSTTAMTSTSSLSNSIGSLSFSFVLLKKKKKYLWYYLPITHHIKFKILLLTFFKILILINFKILIIILINLWTGTILAWWFDTSEAQEFICITLEQKCIIRSSTGDNAPYTWWQVFLLLPHWLHGTAYRRTLMSQHLVFLKTNLRWFRLGLHFKNYFPFNNVFNTNFYFVKCYWSA